MKELLEKNKKLCTILIAIFGFISDVLTPLAPFSKYLFFLFLITSLVLLSAIIIKKLKEKLAAYFIFSCLACFVTGLMYGLQFSGNDSKNYGYFSANIPLIHNIQNSLLNIEAKVDDIKKDTAHISATIDKVDTKIDKLSDSVGKQGGLIADPQSKDEFYHNARIYELNGDYAKARQSYLKYFSYPDNKIDVHLRFQSFLKIQEGFAGAREIYNELFGKSDALVDQFSIILLGKEEFLTENLQKFSEEHPDFGQAYYNLAQRFSEKALGKQTTADKKNELNYYKKFLENYDSGKLARLFLDKEVLDQELKTAKDFINILSKSNLDVNPVHCNVMLFNALTNDPEKSAEIYDDTALEGGYISCSISEEAVKVEAQIDNDPVMEISNIDTAGYQHAKTLTLFQNKTQQSVSTTFNLPLPKRLDVSKVSISYVDANNNKNGPIELELTSKGVNGRQLDVLQTFFLNMNKNTETRFVPAFLPPFSNFYLWDIKFSTLYITDKLYIGTDKDKLEEFDAQDLLKKIWQDKSDPTWGRAGSSLKLDANKFKGKEKLFFKFLYIDGTQSQIYSVDIIDPNANSAVTPGVSPSVTSDVSPSVNSQVPQDAAQFGNVNSQIEKKILQEMEKGIAEHKKVMNEQRLKMALQMVSKVDLNKMPEDARNTIFKTWDDEILSGLLQELPEEKRNELIKFLPEDRLQKVQNSKP